MSRSLFSDQPPALGLIFMLEFWERFGFYTVQGILTLYFIRYLGYADMDAYYTFGAFSALVYGMIVIGGFLGDKVLGTKRTLILGLVILSSGYAFLALMSKTYVFYALGLICVGNGIFKANPASLLSKCYEKNDPRLHSGFTLYYMAINLGSIFALFIGPIASSYYGYSAAYFISSAGLIIALISYRLFRNQVAHIKVPADQKKVGVVTWLLVIAGILGLMCCAAYLLQHVLLAKNLLGLITLLVLGYYCILMSREPRASRLRMIIALILMIEAIIFFTLYQQMPTSINLFAVHNVNPHLLGLIIDPQSYQALNPIWIVTLSPLLAYLYSKLNKKKINFSIPYKFALGMTMCAISFLILYCSRYFYFGKGEVSSWWLVLSYFFQSLGELLVSALGVAMVAELVPASISGFVMGMWFLTSSIAGFLGATLASYTSLPKHLNPGLESLTIYTQVFAYIGGGTLIIALLMWLLAPLLNSYIYPDNKKDSKTKKLKDVALCNEH